MAAVALQQLSLASLPLSLSLTRQGKATRQAGRQAAPRSHALDVRWAWGTGRARHGDAGREPGGGGRK